MFKLTCQKQLFFFFLFRWGMKGYMRTRRPEGGYFFVRIWHHSRRTREKYLHLLALSCLVLGQEEATFATSCQDVVTSGAKHSRYGEASCPHDFVISRSLLFSKLHTVEPPKGSITGCTFGKRDLVLKLNVCGGACPGRRPRHSVHRERLFTDTFSSYL